MLIPFDDQHFQVAHFVGIGNVPAVAGLCDQGRIILEQIVQLFPVGGEVGVDLLRHRTFAVVAEGVLVQQFAQVELGLVLASATELLHELRVDVGEGLRLFLDELAEPLDGGRLVGDEHGHLLEFVRGHLLSLLLGQFRYSYSIPSHADNLHQFPVAGHHVVFDVFGINLAVDLREELAGAFDFGLLDGPQLHAGH